MEIGGGALFRISELLFSFVLVLLVMYIVLILLHIKPIGDYERKIKESYTRMFSDLKDSIAGMEVIKTNNLQKRKEQKFTELVLQFLNSNYCFGKIEVRMSSIAQLIEGFFVVFIWCVGSKLVLEKEITLGELVMFNSLIYFFMNPIKELIGSQSEIENVIISFDRLNDIFESDEEDIKREYKGSLDWKRIEVKDLSFSYDSEHYVLSNLNFSTTSGKSVAIVGKSGSGKSTFAKLLVALEDSYEGTILVDNINLNNIPIELIRDNIVYVPQNTFLFNGSVKDNLFFENIDGEFVNEILLACGIEGNYDGLGIDFMLCENGNNLSGGQRQKIAMARALIKSPRILILDEATCHMDKETEKEIIEFIKKKFPDIILLMITHNEEIANKCDEIINFSM